MKIILVRHGETQWNAEGRLQGRENVPLNEAGRQQGAAVGKALRLYPFSGHGPVIISSSLQRAVQTARLIAGELSGDVALHTDDALLERDYGKASGLTKAERMAMYPEEIFPGLEDRQKAEMRIIEGITRLCEQFYGQNLILVSHGEICHIFLAKLRGDTTHTGRTALKNAGISTLSYERGQGFSIEYYNQSAEELTEILKGSVKNG